MKVRHTVHKHPNQQQVDDYILDVMSHFDFERVEECMSSMNWHWGMPPTNCVPDINEIKAAALNLLQSATSDLTQPTIKATGGFEARYELFRDGGKNYFRIDLAFTVEDTTWILSSQY
jgi:hypothetical protein